MAHWIANRFISSNPVSKFFHRVPEGSGDPAIQRWPPPIFDLGNGLFAKSKVQKKIYFVLAKFFKVLSCREKNSKDYG